MRQYSCRPLWIVAALFAAESPCAAQRAAHLASQRFEVDPMHSTVAFASTIVGAIKVRGRFTAYDATIICDTLHPERSSVTAIIDVASLTTDMKFRDDHLRSPDFFDVKQFPTIEFVSDTIRRMKGGVRVGGILTMHGVSHRIAFPAKMLLAPRMRDNHQAQAAFSAELRVSRKDFGIAGDNKFNPSYNPVTNMLSDSVDILLELDANREGHTNRTLGTGTPPGVADTVNRVYRSRGVPAAVETFKTLRATQPAAYRYSAGQLDLIGHQLLERGDLRDAVDILRANAELFGDTAGVLESLGEALAFADDAPASLDAYRRSLAKFPASSSAREMARHLERIVSAR